ncbi:DUF968 domain-containing protein [Erwinia persicina]|uniref:DUF968 domain-containing protein n=1 Tax=Erwinia persicina TaxID=55211 RepID=UPI002104B722|nr:DUF968 domain-containing protein [Erwinia persicina]MCQ4105181.1 DUF968 domain-containing protein [Erwinia persicina]UTX11393.1 DUF968 domain-containing protein [Erwinia persicina]
MRALLKPCIQPDLGIVLLRPGSELMSLFRSRRVLICTEPHYMHSLPSGQLAEAEQPLLDHPGMLTFFTHERVIRAAGGINVLEEHLMRVAGGCQWSGDWHSSDHTTLRTGNGAVRLCYHCDNKLREVEPSPPMLNLAARNTALWVIDRACSAFMLPEAHQLTLPELCWWAATKSVTDLMPENAARQVLKLPEEKPLAGTLKESRIKPEPSAVRILEEQAKQVLEMAIDPETPETFLLRPKRRRWSNEKYTQWVKQQPCLCCGKQADDPHHLIGYGQGGMGTKAHDLFVLPLCRAHHDELHADARAFEAEYGTQPELIIRTLDRALSLGVIATGKKNSGDKNV